MWSIQTAIIAAGCLYLGFLLLKWLVLDKVAARRLCRRANGAWQEAASGRSFKFRPAACLGEHPELEGLHRGRKFKLDYQFDDDVEIPPQPRARVSLRRGDCAHVVFTESGRSRIWHAGEDMLDSLLETKGFVVEQHSRLGRFKLQTTSRPFVERLLADNDLSQRISLAVENSVDSVGTGRDGAFAYFDWFESKPEDALQILDLLCDLADAAEGASAKSKPPASPI